jgi:hypothetical protein
MDKCQSKRSSSGCDASLPSASNWVPYTATERAGKLCRFLCSHSSTLPIRDVLNEHGDGKKWEPHYEDGTYNTCAGCNQRGLASAVNKGLSHILFVTRYFGLEPAFRDRYFITGFFEIGEFQIIDDRVAVRAKVQHFVAIEDAWEITDDRWRDINLDGDTDELSNLRYATQIIDGKLFEEILEHLQCRRNAVADYLREISRLSGKYFAVKHSHPCS